MYIGNPFLQFPSAGGGADSTESLYFDGVDESGNAGSISMMQNVGVFTFMCWVRPDSVTGTDRLYWQYFNGNRNVRIEMVNAKLNVIIRNAATSPNYGSTLTDNDVFSTTTWHHLAVVYDGSAGAGSRVIIYVDGSSVADTVTGAFPPTTASNSVDSYIIHSSNLFEGYLDEVALFDYAMTSGEVTTAYNSAVTNDYTSLVSGAPEHYWRFETGDGDDQTTVNDQGDTGTADITLTNMEIGDYSSEVP